MILICTLKYFQYMFKYLTGEAIWRKRVSGYQKRSFYKRVKIIEKICTPMEMDTFDNLVAC
jgi:hypothetical protein